MKARLLLLERERDSLLAILDENPGVVYRARAAGDFGATYLSAGITAQLGYQPRDFTEDASFWADHVHPEDRARVIAELGRAVGAGRGTFEYRFRHQDGTYRLMRDECHVDAKSTPPELIGYWTDITERKEAEELLRKSEHRFRVLFESSRDAIMTAAPPSWAFTSGNPATLAMFRMHDERAFISTAPWELSPECQPDGRRSDQAAKASIETAMREGSHFFEWRHKRADGEEFPATVQLTRCDLGNEAFVQATVRDITEQRRAQEAIREAQEELEIRVTQRTAELASVNSQLTEEIAERSNAESLLREQRNELNQIYQTAPIGLALLDRDLRFLRINDVLAAINGVPAADHRGKTLRDVIPHLAGRAEPLYRQVIDSGEPVLGVEITGRTQATPDKDHHWLVSYYPLVANDGTVRAVQTIVQDVTAQKIAEAELSQRGDELEELVQERTAELTRSQARLRRSERLASLGTLAAGIAHEINNPVGAILLAAGYASRTWEGPDGDRMIRRTLRDIEREAVRCGEVVRVVLQFARQEPLEMKRQNLSPVVAEAVRATRQYAQEREAVITVHPSSPLPDVLMNETALHQALANVIRNAVESGDVGVQVEIETREAGAWVQIAVTDNGAGISLDDQAHLFDPFFTTRWERGGTGLGLSFAHGVLLEHGGRIEVTSTEGAGTTFTFMLPTEREEPVEGAQ